MLPPIKTAGLTAVDVTKLSVDTREVMLKTLKEISAPVNAEVEQADNAALAKISKEAPSTSVLTPVAPDVATEPAGASEATSSTRPPAETEPATKQSASATSNVGPGGGVPVSEGDVARDRKISLSSAEDDELVIVPRPDQNQTM